VNPVGNKPLPVAPPAESPIPPPAADTPPASSFPNQAPLDPDEALLDVMKKDGYQVPRDNKKGEAFVQTKTNVAVTKMEPLDLTHVTLEDWMARRKPQTPAKFAVSEEKPEEEEAKVSDILAQVSSLTGKRIPLRGAPVSFLQVSHISTSFRLALQRQGLDSPSLQELISHLQQGSEDDNLKMLKALRLKLDHAENPEHKKSGRNIVRTRSMQNARRCLPQGSQRIQGPCCRLGGRLPP